MALRTLRRAQRGAVRGLFQLRQRRRRARMTMLMRWLDRLLVLCAAVLVLVNVAPLAARLVWIMDLTTHFRVQYLAATAVVLAALALRRRWRAVAALAAAGTVSAWAVAPYLPLELVSA